MFPKPDPARLVNALLGLGVLILLAGLAGLAATSLIGTGASDATAAGPAPALRPARIDGKYGYVDAGGRVIIAPRFDGADTFSEGLALVLDRGRFGYIDVRGAFAIPAVFRHALPFRDGFAAVRSRDGWMYLDRDGNRVAYGAPAFPDDTSK